MHKAQEQVEDFHRALDLPIGETPEIRRPQLRASLILEEAVETVVALLGHQDATVMVARLAREMGRVEREAEESGIYPEGTQVQPDLAEAIDGLCDTLVVTYGTAVEMGVDLEPFFDEVNRTNMAKAGGPIREDGKRLKPPGWTPPKIAEMLAEGVGHRRQK